MFCRWKIKKKSGIGKGIATCCDFLQKRRSVGNLQCFRFKIFDTTQCIRTAAILLTGCCYVFDLDYPAVYDNFWVFFNIG